jgi:glycyl-tRNA synthetase beta chain
MTEKKDLLVEIGTEELPPKALKRLMEAFGNGIVEGLAKADLGHGAVKRYATPRRLAVLVHELTETQPDRAVERRGPALTAGFDEEGRPTKAAEGFARSCGVRVDDLEKMESDKGAWLVFRTVQKGVGAAELVPGIVQEALDRLPIPKRMRWGDLAAEFVRPVHWVVMLFGDTVVDAEILSVHSGRETRGHRFHHPERLYLGEPAAYAPLLETEGKVIADFADRREAIRAQVLEAAANNGGRAVIDDDLLDEVTGLVEWPVAVVGNFDPRFLEIPAEALVSAMKGHQKYFHMVDAKGQLMPHFVTVSNIESQEPSVVREGNERVILPRLSDADFFWNQDRKRRLEERLGDLDNVVFQQKLGSLGDKARRIAGLAETIAGTIGGDPKLAAEAARLSKCDLLTEMVGEFPELQGIMGRYYAVHDGHAEEVAQALDEQYMPRFAGDELPATTTGQAVAIADRVDTLVGIFGIGQPPSGDKDPFGLRRAALGVLRIMIERHLDLDLEHLIRAAAGEHEASGTGLAFDESVQEQVFEFMLERLRRYYHDMGIGPDTFEAVAARRPARPLDFDRRVRAVDTFRRLPEAEALAGANKRIANILRQAEGKIPETVAADNLEEPAEKALATQVEELAVTVSPLFDQGAYEEALKELASLREPVDTFFEEVMVMAEDPALRGNRLALLKRLSDLFLRAADISRLQG